MSGPPVTGQAVGMGSFFIASTPFHKRLAWPPRFGMSSSRRTLAACSVACCSHDLDDDGRRAAALVVLCLDVDEATVWHLVPEVLEELSEVYAL